MVHADTEVYVGEVTFSKYEVLLAIRTPLFRLSPVWDVVDC